MRQKEDAVTKLLVQLRQRIQPAEHEVDKAGFCALVNDRPNVLAHLLRAAGNIRNIERPLARLGINLVGDTHIQARPLCHVIVIR